MNMIKDYVERLLLSKNEAHLYHLSTTLYVHHIALQEYYEEITNMIDELVETYQGKYGILNLEIPYENNQNLNSLEYFEELAKWLELSRTHLPEDNFLQHQFDDIETLTYKTLYKLKYLK